MNNSKELKTGFTTGACATAAAVASWQLLSGMSSDMKSVEILFPDGKKRSLDLAECTESTSIASSTVIKDAGDDPDITNGCHVSTEVSFCKYEDIKSSDIVLPISKGELVLRGGKGIGTVVSNGLDVPIGKSAINPGPQKMFVQNFELLFLKKIKNPVLIEITIKEGELLGPRTLNNILGVEGGLSILGTSGIVIPCSNKAYVKTIEMLIRGAVREGENTIYAVTGGKTHKLVRKQFPDANDHAVIRIGDFIKQTIVYGDQNGCSEIVIGCMPGKLAKYALGYEYTHAAHIRTNMDGAASLLEENGMFEGLCEKLRNARSIRAFLNTCTIDEQTKIYEIWASSALLNFKTWASSMTFKIILFGFESQLLGEWEK